MLYLFQFKKIKHIIIDFFIRAIQFLEMKIKESKSLSTFT